MPSETCIRLQDLSTSQRSLASQNPCSNNEETLQNALWHFQIPGIFRHPSSSMALCVYRCAPWEIAQFHLMSPLPSSSRLQVHC